MIADENDFDKPYTGAEFKELAETVKVLVESEHIILAGIAAKMPRLIATVQARDKHLRDKLKKLSIAHQALETQRKWNQHLEQEIYDLKVKHGETIDAKSD